MPLCSNTRCIWMSTDVRHFLVDICTMQSLIKILPTSSKTCLRTSIFLLQFPICLVTKALHSITHRWIWMTFDVHHSLSIFHYNLFSSDDVNVSRLVVTWMYPIKSCLARWQCLFSSYIKSNKKYFLKEYMYRNNFGNY